MTVSQVVRRLEANGYLKRCPHPRDTRAHALALLAKGRKALDAAIPAVEAVDDEVFGVLGAQEAQLRELLGRLIN
jgi:DNA-binding MarR family transcriptional regulator